MKSLLAKPVQILDALSEGLWYTCSVNKCKWAHRGFFGVRPLSSSHGIESGTIFNGVSLNAAYAISNYSKCSLEANTWG